MGVIKDRTGLRYGRLTVLKSVVLDRKFNRLHWVCRCDCGNETTVYGGDLQTGRVVSCNCYRKEKHAEVTKGKPGKKKHPLGVVNFNRVFKRYKFWAKTRKKEWNLSKEQFRDITSQNCHYCAQAPNNKVNFRPNKYAENGYYLHNGIDRKDNNIGYIVENCLPCCTNCNTAKMTLSYDGFLNLIRSIATNLNLK